MALNIAQHPIEEICNVRCSVVEKGITPKRMRFLKNILEVNGFEVRTEKMETENDVETYIIGVTDVTFNPIIAIYAHGIKTPNNELVTPAFWNQTEKTPDDKYYWEK